MTFLEFVRGLPEMDSPVGDLCRDLLRDEGFPENPVSFELVRRRLNRFGASHLFGSARKLWNAYEAYRQLIE